MPQLLFNSKPLVQSIVETVPFVFECGFEQKSENPELEKTTYTVVIKSGDGDRLIAFCPELQGVLTDGKDYEEVSSRIHDAITEMLEVLGKPSKDFNLRLILNLWLLNPTPEELVKYLKGRNFKIVSSKKYYIMYNGIKYTSIPKNASKIKEKYLEDILGDAGISIGEFEQEFNG